VDKEVAILTEKFDILNVPKFSVNRG
jgi:hypothetical protein